MKKIDFNEFRNLLDEEILEIEGDKKFYSFTRRDQILNISFNKCEEEESIVTIFPSFESTFFGFKKIQLTESFLSSLNPKINQDYINTEINKINLICDKEWQKNKKNEIINKNYFSLTILRITLYLTILAFLLMMYMVLYNRQNDNLIYIGLSIFCICSFINIIIVIKTLFTKNTYIDINTSINKRIINELTKINKEYKNYNLSWKKGYRSYWLELIKD